MKEVIHTLDILIYIQGIPERSGHLNILETLKFDNKWF